MARRRPYGKKRVPFEEWPGDVRLAFEKYYALDARQRTLEAAAVLSGAGADAVKKWSTKYGWATELEERDRALATEERERTLERRRGILRAAEAGVGTLITRYAAAAQNKCPVCMGKGLVSRVLKVGRGGEKAITGEEICPTCEGSGFYDAMNLNVLAFDRVIARYGIMAGDLSDPANAPRGPISHEEWMEYQRDMLEVAGAKVARQIAALPPGEVIERDT